MRRMHACSSALCVVNRLGGRPGCGAHHRTSREKGVWPWRGASVSGHACGSAKDSSSGATRTTRPYARWRRATSCTTWPDSSEQRYGRRLAAQARGPGKRASGWKVRL